MTPVMMAIASGMPNNAATSHVTGEVRLRLNAPQCGHDSAERATG